VAPTKKKTHLKMSVDSGTDIQGFSFAKPPVLIENSNKFAKIRAKYTKAGLFLGRAA
jgi:hypothetical protein